MSCCEYSGESNLKSESCLHKGDVLKSSIPIPSIHHPLMSLSTIIVNLQGNYNRKIAPFVFDESTWSNKPANVSVSMAVTDILKIEEVDHTYTMKFRLVLEW